MIPILLTIIPLIPGLVRSALDITEALRRDPTTPENDKKELDRVAAELHEIIAKVLAAPLPPKVD